MALTDAEKANIQRQITDLEGKLEAEKVSSDGLGSKETEAAENDATIRKQWAYFHQIILNYEKEIERLNGQYILNPFSEKDLEDQALEKGRLYQAPASQDPKTIQEMTGGGLAPQPKVPHEGTHDDTLDKLINTFLNGEDGGPTALVTTLNSGYTAGSSTISTVGSISPNRWYLIGGVTLIRVGSVSGTMPGPYTGNITQRYFLPGLDVSVGSGGAVSTWGGYTNVERTSKVATSTSQSMFNVLFAHLQDYLNRYKNIIAEQLDLLNRNPDPDKSLTAITENQTYISRVDSYIASNYPLNNGTPGIGTLQLILSDRTVYRAARPAQAVTAKEAYYADRINMTRLRVNIQSGTLTRVKFLDTVRELTPAGGDPGLKRTIKSLKALLQD